MGKKGVVGMKWIRRILGGILVLLLVMIGALFLIPAERIAKVATDQLRNVTGRDVSITGNVSMSIWPVLGVSAEGLEVGNAEWAKDGPMLTAQSAAIGVDAMALLQGEVRITNIEATSPTIRLEQRLDGRASWEFTDASGAQIETETDPDSTPQAFSIQRLAITDATLVYDAEGSDLVSYEGVDLTLDWPERLGDATIDAVLRPAGQAVSVKAKIGQFAGFIAGQVQPVDVAISAGQGSAALLGRASTAGEVAGKLTLNIPDTDAFFGALALPAPGLPRGLGAAVSMTTDLTLTTDRRLSLRALVADLGGNKLNGAADISLNGTPQINAQLDAGALDLTGLTGDDGSDANAAEPAGGGWPKDAIDASGLAGFNGEIALKASSIDLGQFKLGATRTLLRNDRSRMVFELREIAAYSGTVTGEFVVNNRSGLSVGGKLFVSQIGMQPLLRDAIGVDRLTGAGDLELSFLGVGENVDAIMKSLSGTGAVSIGQGTIEGIDLDRLMQSGDGSGGTTIFDSLGMTFVMDQGNLVNEDLLLALRTFEARGAGRVGLGVQDIDYLFTPIALNLNDGNGLAIPIRIRGPWSGPRIIPDLEAALDLNLEAEKEKLKEQARAAARKVEDDAKAKIAEELGVAEGEDLKDAAKNKLENEVKKSLRSLFD